LPFPANNKLKCPACSAEIDLGDTRRQIELQTKKEDRGIEKVEAMATLHFEIVFEKLAEATSADGDGATSEDYRGS